MYISEYEISLECDAYSIFNGSIFIIDSTMRPNTYSYAYGSIFINGKDNMLIKGFSFYDIHCNSSFISNNDGIIEIINTTFYNVSCNSLFPYEIKGASIINSIFQRVYFDYLSKSNITLKGITLREESCIGDLAEDNEIMRVLTYREFMQLLKSSSSESSFMEITNESFSNESSFMEITSNESFSNESSSYMETLSLKRSFSILDVFTNWKIMLIVVLFIVIVLGIIVICIMKHKNNIKNVEIEMLRNSFNLSYMT